MLVSEIFLLVAGALQDLGSSRRWPWEITTDKLSMVDLINAAIREVAINRPDSTSVTESVQLETGSRQTIPKIETHGATYDALSLLEIIQNMGDDGETPGDPCFRVTREAMNGFDWNITGTVVDNYAYDKLINQQVFYISPSLSERTYVELTYSAEPTIITSSTDTFPLPSPFAGATAQWMLYLIFSGDNSDANFTRAQHHAQAFYQSIGVKLKSDLFFPDQVKQRPGGKGK